MVIKKFDSYEKSLKKLKKYNDETLRLNKILELIKNSESLEHLKINPISKMYGFEALKYDLTGYYSFNLCKSRGGMIRLIVSIDELNTEMNLVYISTNHYEDFKRRGE